MMKNKEIEKVSQGSLVIKDLAETKKLCETLLDTVHYQKITAPGIYAIVQKAKQAGLNPLEALNGGMYYVQGKVEMSSAMMNDLIRRAGHSITKDKKSDNKVCILHGKRRDNNDTWSESFSIEDAQLAGIFHKKNKYGQTVDSSWQKYPRDMLFARALSRLARQLFPDVIHGCYVEGEIAQAVEVEKEEIEVQVQINPNFPDISHEIITEDQVKIIEDLIGDNTELKAEALDFIEKQFGYRTFEVVPVEMFGKLCERAEKAIIEREIEETEEEATI